MKQNVTAFSAGLLFAIGLGVARMTQPGKVIGFLDFSGDWNPALIFVMAGAVIVYAIGYRLVVRKARPMLDSSFHLPTKSGVDRNLAVGATLFGIGWGLSGFCPGPAVVSLASFNRAPWIFVVAMITGMAIQRQLFRNQ